MPITTVSIANIGSPADDPTCPLPATLYVPDTTLFPPPRPCIVGWQSAGFQNGGNKPVTMLADFAAVGFMGLHAHCRLMINPISGQTTDGKWHQQTDDCKIAIEYMRTNPGNLGYLANGFVGCFGGSGSAHHAMYMALDGTLGVDRADAAICMSPPTDFGNRTGISQSIINIVTVYGRSTDLPTLTSRSPISLDLDSATKILHYNGDSESMGLSMLTVMNSEMAGNSNYTAITNTGAAGDMHSFDMWAFIGDDAVNWMVDQEAEWAEVDPEPQTIYSEPMWNIVIVQNNGRSLTYRYQRTGSGAYSQSDAIYQATHRTGLNTPLASITVTAI